MKAMFFLFIVLSLGSIGNTTVADTTNVNQSTPGVWFKALGQPKAVVLVAHGLNLKPEKMDTLAGLLRDAGADVLRITLSGHEGDMAAFKNVNSEIWERDFNSSYAEALTRSRQLKVPLYFLGFSLGALVGVRSMIEENSSTKFDRMVLLAPAISLKTATKLLHPLKLLGRGFCIPSANLPEYRVHRCTPMGAYGALLDCASDVNDSDSQAENIPTLIMMDPKDEMVSLESLKKFATKKKLTNWNFVEFTSSQTLLPKKFHHLIVDEAGAGHAEWKVIIENLLRHFSLL